MSPFQRLSCLDSGITRWQDFQGYPIEAWKFIYILQPSNDSTLSTASFILTEAPVDWGHFLQSVIEQTEGWEEAVGSYSHSKPPVTEEKT